MRPIVTVRCCNAGCTHLVRLVPFATLTGFVDLTEGLCRPCLELVDAGRRAVLSMARLELRLSPGLAQIVLLVRAWEAVKMSAAERSVRRAA